MSLESLEIKRVKGTREVSIGNYEYNRLEERAEELGVQMRDILEWLIEECMDEYEI